MKLTTSLYSVIQQCVMGTKFLFFFYVFHCDLKEKYPIGSNINCQKKEKFVCEISIIIMICQILDSAGPVQQKIKLPSPKAFGNNSSPKIKLSKTQLHKIVQPGGFLGKILGPLLKSRLPLIGNVLKLFARSVININGSSISDRCSHS